MNAKKRNLHLGPLDCRALAESSEGSTALTNPYLVKRSSRDVNRGLYPQRLWTKPGKFPCIETQTFQKEVMEPQKVGGSKMSSPAREDCHSPGPSGHNSPSRRKLFSPSKTIVSPLKKMKVDDEPEEQTPSTEFETESEKDDLELSAYASDIEAAALLSSDESSWSHSEGDKEDKKDTYGLLGLGNLDEISEFSRLYPFSDILENIFCHLPVTEFLNSMLVCKAWHSIISKFMPWKMNYQKVRCNDPSTMERIKELMANELILVGSKTSLLGIIRFLGKEFSKKKRKWKIINNTLKDHVRYKLCKKMLLERLPDNMVTNPWCVIGGLVVLSQSTKEVISIINLYNRNTASRAIDILEPLYCIINFLSPRLTCRNNPGIHYRVFYSLSQYETLDNSNGLTSEQLKIVNANFNQPSDIIKIVAFAGTGKTRTLREHAAANSHRRFLYVAFNKSVQVEAENSFPSNVTCKTIHSLAYKEYGVRYKNKLLKGRNMNPFWYSQGLPRLGINSGRYETNLMTRAKFVCNALKAFMASADDVITSLHVDHTKEDRQNGEIIVITEMEKNEYVDDANILWEKMKNLHDKSIQMPHDGYLKLYQLSKPVLDYYDCLLIDEAQDLTPAIQDILLRQNCTKILVGDPYQQIYAFRGAVNAMRLIDATQTFSLTKSFRFGPEIAYVASCLLLALKNVKSKTLVGNNTSCSINGEVQGQMAILARTNHYLFNEAVKYCVANPNAKIAFAGGIHSFGLDLILDIRLLQMPPCERRGRTINNFLIKKFQSLLSLEEHADLTNDVELLGKIKIVKQHHINIDRYVNMLKAQASGDMSFADVIFSTVHKAKGLEFDTVKLANDFLTIGSTLTSLENIDEDEKNMLYVAVTRAKKSLLLTSTLLQVLRFIGERYEFPEESSNINPDQCTLKDCPMQHQPLLTMRAPQIKLGSGDILKKKIYCDECAKSHCPGWGQLVGPLEPVS